MQFQSHIIFQKSSSNYKEHEVAAEKELEEFDDEFDVSIG